MRIQLDLNPSLMIEQSPVKQITMSEFTNSVLVEMKSLSNTLKPFSNSLYDNNNKLMNRLLVAKDEEIRDLIICLLGHFLHIGQDKNFTHVVLSLLSKIVNCIKTMPPSLLTSQEEHESMRTILSHLIDILTSMANQHKNSQDICLRIIQTTFSLIDQIIMPYFDNTILTRIYSICFEFCQGVSILQNISVSALFALTECLFQYGQVEESFLILDAFLEYLFTRKRVIWIKSTDLKGLMWDLVSTSIKNCTANHLIKLEPRDQTKQNLNKMYETATDTILLKKNKEFYSVSMEPHQKGQNNQQTIHEFMRYFKAYSTFSTSLSLEAHRVLDREYVPFRATIPKLILVCELERNSRMYIFLEVVCQLLLNQYDLPLSLDRGMVFMEILARISEELCLFNEMIKVNWEINEYFLDKLCHEEPKISDGDFVRLIKNTIFQMRLKFEKDSDLLECRKNYKEMSSISSSRSGQNLSVSLPQNMNNVKKWEQFIKSVIKIVRYLSSLNFENEEEEEDPTRKIILELQYWFLLCPVSKGKSMLLQELLMTANILNNKMQAVKVSQSVQIGSNIMYGYFEELDSVGLTIILKMMAGIKADWEEGKSFEELDEIYNLANSIFTEEKFIQTDASFNLTIQALVQCSNSILADIEQPKEKTPQSSLLTNSFKRMFKMLDYLTQRMIMVIKHNQKRTANEWNFITAFLITLCYNKNGKIKEKGIELIGVLVKIVMKFEYEDSYEEKKEHDIMGLYLQLCKAQIKDIEMTLLEQLKMIMPGVKQQSALMDGFRITKIFLENAHSNKDMIGSLHDLQEILIKECLFRVVEVKYLRMILEGLQAKFSEKNEEYRLINLIWSIADHLRQITPKNAPSSQDFIALWEILFKNIWHIGESSQECETKQSAIHAITQILGEATSVLPIDFLLHIVSRYFQELVLLLLGILPNSVIELEKTSQTAKISLKNYIKLFKMLISLENKSFEQEEKIKQCMNSINTSISKYIQEHVDNQITGTISLELILELLNFINLIYDDKGFNDYDVKQDLKSIFCSIEKLIIVCEDNGMKMGNMDLNSHLYKKKVKGMMEKLREREMGPEVVVEN